MVVFFVVLFVFGGSYAGYREYVSLRHAHLIKQTRAYLAKAKPRKALLCLQTALRHNPKDVEACRLMADLMESAHSPSALVWRSRVVELDPHSMEDRLALAQTAVSLQDYITATNALDGVDAAGKKTAAYQNVAGVVAAASRQFAQAETHFLEALRVEPQNAVAQLNLAAVQLQGTNAPAQAEARAALQRMATNPTNSPLRCEALRRMTVDAMRNKRTVEALAVSKALLQETNCTFGDRLLRLSVLQDARDPEFKPSLAAFQREAAADTASDVKIYELGFWQMEKLGPADALAWLRSMPLLVQTNQPVAPLIADCLVAQKDWNGLQHFLERQDWGGTEFGRLALNSRALREQGLEGAAKGEWELALKAANGRPQTLAMLLRLAAQWRWDAEAEDILWTFVNRYPEQKWATEALMQTLYTSGRTRSLMTLFSQQAKENPSNLAIKNNLAMTALLLNAQELKPYDLAREVYQESPSTASFASTYAFALHLQKKDPEALKIMQQLAPRDLQDPGIAGYYGLILEATGDREKALVYLRVASKARSLPEEKKLFDGAMAGT